MHGCGDGLPSIVRKHFPNALNVADRFHVIRLINRHLFGGTWILPRPTPRLLSLMRRHRHDFKPEQRVNLSNLPDPFSRSRADL